jgi:Double zinc ribbon
LGIILAIALFIQFRYLRPRRDDAIEMALNRDDAYNALTTAQAVSSALKDKGRDTKEADLLLVEAELAYNRGDFLKCTDASKRAKEYLAVAPMAIVDFTTTPETSTDQPNEPLPEQPKISEARKLPPNYLESKFMIATAADEIERNRSEGKNVTASVCLLDEAKMAFDCKDYNVALRKSLKAKKSAEAPTEPAPNKPVEIIKLEKAPEPVLPERTVAKETENPPATKANQDRCASCGTSARDDDNFCAKCGKPIERKRLCANCGAELSEDDVFCRKCGTEVRA